MHGVVIHGWFYDWRVFEPMLPALDPEVFTLAFMDCRGYGSSREIGGPYNVDTIAADALELAEYLRWDRCSLVGHSMGGKAALRAAALQPERVEAILALTPVWAGAAPFDVQTLAFFRDAVRNVGGRAAILENGGKGEIPGAWARWMAQKSDEVSTKDAFGSYLESWATDDFSDEVRHLPQRVLAIAGESDVGIPPAAIESTWIANLENAQMQVLDDCGHYPMLERPLALARIFERFLRKPDHAAHWRR